MKQIDNLSGDHFEQFISNVFSADLRCTTHKTSFSHDYGIDVIFKFSGKEIGLQCKHTTGHSLGYSAVEDALAGRDFYNLDKGYVITNDLFSNHAKRGAKKLKIGLINRDNLIKFGKIGKKSPSES